MERGKEAQLIAADIEGRFFFKNVGSITKIMITFAPNKTKMTDNN